MKCLTNNLEVNYPCSAVCPLYGDCVTAFRKEQEQRVRTNADRIRCMSDEDLAKFLAGFDPHCCNCPADGVCGGCSSTPPRDCAWWFEEWLQEPCKMEGQDETTDNR